MASVILDFYDEDAPSSLLGSLEDDDLESLEHRPTLFDIGALVFRVPKATADDNPTLLRKKNIVRVRYPTPMGSTRVWAGILKDTRSVIVSTKEQHGEYVEWTAPGILYMLSYGSLGTESTVSDQPARGSVDDVPARDWIWINEPYGAILTRLIEEGRHAPFPDPAATDAALADVTIDFDRTTDSNGNPWANIAEEFRVPIGANMLDVAARLATAGDLFLVMDPDLTLHAYQEYADFATDRTGSFGAGNVRWQKGVNILTELSRQSTALELTHLVQRDSDGNSSTEVAAGYTSGREHWGYSEVDSTNDDTTLNKIAQRAIGASGQDAEQIAFEVSVGNDEAAGDYFPFLHYNPGDLVSVDTGSGEYDLDDAALRVVGVRITLDEASKSSTAQQAYRSLHVVPELAYRPVHTFTTNRSIPGDPGATPGCVCLKFCTPGVEGTGNSVLFTRTWSYNTNTNSDTGDYPWGTTWVTSGSGLIPALSGSAYARSTGSPSLSTKMPCVEGGVVTLTGKIARNWFTDKFVVKDYVIRWYDNIGAPSTSFIAKETLSPAPCSRNVAAVYSLSAIAPPTATYFAILLDDNAGHDDVVVTSYDTDGTPGTEGCMPEDIAAAGDAAQGASGFAAHQDHVHAHAMLGEDGAGYHDITQITGFDVGAAVDGDVMTFDDTTGLWVPAAPSGGSGAPTTVNYLVGTADAGLSAEIVVGTTPGGELGGTWASPTVDATHSGSAHHAESHQSRHNAAGADALKLDDLAAPDDNTDLNASTGAHGLLPKLGGGSTNYLRADGSWSNPGASGGAVFGPGYAVRAIPEGSGYEGGTAGMTPASTAYASLITIPAPMKLRALRVRVTATTSGTDEWGIFATDTLTKIAGGSGVAGSTGWQNINATGAPVDVAPGQYVFILARPATGLGSLGILNGSSLTPWISKGSYTWTNTPSFASGWSDYANRPNLHLVGDMDGSGTQWVGG